MDPFIGEIRLVGFNFAPNGWAQCNGQSLPINMYTPLFALIGVTFGGDGVQHFNLPKLPPNGSANYIIATAGVFPSRP